MQFSQFLHKSIDYKTINETSTQNE